MDLRSSFFAESMNVECKDIMIGPMIEMIGELSANAIFVMSTDIDSSVTGRVTATIVDILKNQKYKYMPFHLVCEGFTRGSMGELGGTTKFSVRNVCTWMYAMFEKLTQINTEKKSREDAERRRSEAAEFKLTQKRSSLFGAAMYWKISHCPMSDSDYDRLTLDKIVEAFKTGYTAKELQPSMIL
jgi:hypothetical protein